MKKGKIILGTIAFVMTAASTLSFKAVNRFNGRPRVHVKDNLLICRTCSSLRSNFAGHPTGASSCWTNSAHVGSKISGTGVGGHTFYKTKTVGGFCLSPTTMVTLLQ